MVPPSLYSQVEVYIFHPPHHVNVTVRLEQQTTGSEDWQLTHAAGLWDLHTGKHPHEFFLAKHRFAVPAGGFTGLRLQCTTTAPRPLPVSIKHLGMPAAARYEVLIAGIILLLVYGLIIFELIPRTLTAMLGAMVTLVVRAPSPFRPPPPFNRPDPQRVRMSSGERPIGAAKGKQPDTEAW